MTGSIDAAIRRPRVGIFFYEGWLGVAPSLLNAVSMLAEAGFEVDVVIRSPTADYAPLPELPGGVRVYECRQWSAALTRLGAKLRRSAPWASSGKPALPPGTKGDQPTGWFRSAYRSVRLSGLLALDVIHFGLFGTWCSLRGRHVAAIGVDNYGLLAASAAMLFRRGPVIYWSLELRFLKDLKLFMGRFFKRLERHCHRRAAMVLVPSSARAAALVAENEADPSTVTIVPNGPRGPAVIQGGRYFHEKFGLSPARHVILHMGMIQPAVCSLELAAAAASWPQEWVLVMHERASPVVRTHKRRRNVGCSACASRSMRSVVETQPHTGCGSEMESEGPCSEIP